MLASHLEDQHAQQHAGPGQCESGMRPIAIAHFGADRGGQEGAEVYADIEDGEATVLPVVAVGVQLAHHGADVRFEQAVADDDHRHAPEQQHFGASNNYEFTDRHQNASQQHRDPRAEDLVGDAAADHWHHIDQGRVRTVHREALIVAHGQALH
jgi:hypothetical protein